MATQRRPGEVETVDPNVDTGPTEGVTTMKEMFGQPLVVDEVHEVPQQYPMSDGSWIVRPNSDVEDMTVGSPQNHFNLKAGTRYRVPERVAMILYNADKLMEIPFPYQPRR